MLLPKALLLASYANLKVLFGMKLMFVDYIASGTLDDAFSLCMASKNTLTSLLLLMEAYREEADYSVLSYLVDVLDLILVVVA